MLLFLGAALLIAVVPGPGMLYVAGRTLAGGRGVGLTSSLGTGIGGMLQVAAGAFGLSALVMASAEAFTAVKFAGALYLLFLGFTTIREARLPLLQADGEAAGSAGRAFRQGVVVEAFNPKVAAFFLAFLPQFIDAARGQVAWQFFLLGTTSVVLNTLADVLVATMASAVRDLLLRRPRLMRRVREASGVMICGLGASLALARRA